MIKASVQANISHGSQLENHGRLGVEGLGGVMRVNLHGAGGRLVHRHPVAQDTEAGLANREVEARSNDVRVWVVHLLVLMGRIAWEVRLRDGT